MEAVEIVVYIGIAVLLGGFIIGFITGWDYIKTYDDIKNLMTGDENLKFEKVDKIGFSKKLHKFFNECTNSGLNMSLSLYVNDNGTMTKIDLFDLYKELGWCDTIQSVNNSCGLREDVQMSDFILPKVIKINCTNNILYIK